MKISFISGPLRLAAFLFFLILAGTEARGQAPAWEWATTAGAGDATVTVADAAGNVYAAGFFTGTATFGSTTLTSAGDRDAFVASLDPSGAYQWAVRVGGAGSDFAQALAFDLAGNVVVAGSISNSVAFGSTTLNAGVGDVFVAKISPAGVWQWAAHASGASNEYATGVTVDLRGGIYVTGWFFAPSMGFGAITLPNSHVPFTDLYVAKLSATGAWEWAVAAGGSDNEAAMGIAADRFGDVYVTGTYVSPTASFGTHRINNSGMGAFQEDIFVARLSSGGTWQWVTGAGGTAADRAAGIVVDRQGDVYITGDFLGLAHFGTTTLNASLVNGEAYVAKLSAAGSWQWAVQPVGSRQERAHALAVDSSGGVYVAGEFDSPTVGFGTTAMLTNSAGGGGQTADVFVARLSPAGSWLWAISGGGIETDQSHGLAVDGAGNVYVSGRFASLAATFGPTTLANPTAGSPNPTFAQFISRLSQPVLAVGEERAAAPLVVYPNPAQGAAWISGAGTTLLRLLDARGQLVRTIPRSDTQDAQLLDLKGLAPGLYLLRNGRHSSRLVVE